MFPIIVTLFLGCLQEKFMEITIQTSKIERIICELI
jgi:hypothetical protein